MMNGFTGTECVDRTVTRPEVRPFSGHRHRRGKAPPQGDPGGRQVQGKTRPVDRSAGQAVRDALRLGAQPEGPSLRESRRLETGAVSLDHPSGELRVRGPAALKVAPAEAVRAHGRRRRRHHPPRSHGRQRRRAVARPARRSSLVPVNAARPQRSPEEIALGLWASGSTPRTLLHALMLRRARSAGGRLPAATSPRSRR